MHGDRPPSDKRLPPHYIGPVIIKWKNKSATLSEQVIFFLPKNGPVPTVWHFYFSILL